MDVIYDVIVIGAGPSGLSACSFLKGLNVLLIDKNNSIGKKLLASGNGRCNVFNKKSLSELVLNYNNKKFLYSTFNKFSPINIEDFFKDNGVLLKEEDNNRMFPISNNSIDILNVYKKKLNDNNVTVKLSTSLNSIINENKYFSIKTNNNTYKSFNVILAMGGKTYSKLGTSGDGYPILESLGHTITELYPSQCALVMQNSITELQGLSIKNAAIKVGKNVVSNFDLIFTHFGISGPLVFRCSDLVYLKLKKINKVDIFIDFKLGYSFEEIENHIIKLKSKKTTFNILKDFLQVRLIEYILVKLKLRDKISADLSNTDIRKIVSEIKEFKVVISGLKGFENAFLTAGGLSLSEVYPNSFKSKLHDNLYIVGELLDIHGYTGGYNISAAISMGYSAAQDILNKYNKKR